MADDQHPDDRVGEPETARRRLLAGTSRLAMLAGLLGGYGAFAWIAGRFLYPARPDDRRWLFVADVQGLELGQTVLYQAPSGERINITRQRRGGGDGDFTALSSTCPHLGCQVRWEVENDRFFCPCHNGVFTPDGKGIGGPPGDAGQSLPRFPLKVERGLLYVEVPIRDTTRASRDGRGIAPPTGTHAAGHDPCLAARRDAAAPTRRA